MSSDISVPGILCASCGKINRKEALWCRFCGSSLATALAESMVGRDDLKQKLAAVVSKLRVGQERVRHGLPAVQLNVHALFTGSTGSGKTLAARLMAQQLYAGGFLKSPEIRELGMEQLERYNGPVSALLQSETARAGFIIIDEVHRNTRMIGQIVNFMEQQVPGNAGAAVFVLTGLHEALQTHFQTENDDLQRFGLIHHFSDYGSTELAAIARSQLERQAFEFGDGVLQALERYAASCLAANETPYRNAWLVEREIIPRILNAQSNRLASQFGTDTPLSVNDLRMLELTDVPSSQGTSEDSETVLRELDALIGLDAVKKEVHRLADTIQIADERRKTQAGAHGFDQTPVHLVLSGNPGTGKTTVARMLGRLFKSIGLLPSDRVLEVDRGKLVAQFLGQTAPLVHRVCDQARGGILFIDEAYTLASAGGGERDPFGQEALDTLLKRMEDDRGEYVVIAAGYPREMKRFISANPGLESRFTTFLTLDDYAPDELSAIFRQMTLRAGLVLDAAAEQRVNTVMHALYDKRDANFANGRAVRTLFEAAVKDQSHRLARMERINRDAANLRTLIAADIDANGDLVPHAEVLSNERLSPTTEGTA